MSEKYERKEDGKIIIILFNANARGMWGLRMEMERNND